MKYWPTKTPTTIRDHGLNWGPTLARIAETYVIAEPTITDSVWTRLQGDVTINAGSIDGTGRKTATRVSGGTPNTNSVFRNTVTLSNGFVLDEDVFLKVRA